jgi:hypothetical protein
MSPTPNTNTSSLNGTDNPSTTTAFMLGAIQGELKSLNNSITEMKTEMSDFRNFKLKMYLIIGAISSVLNIPAVYVIMGKL